MTTEYLIDLIGRIATALPQVAGPDDCPPLGDGHGACDKCEIYFLLYDFADNLPSHSEDCGCETCELKSYIENEMGN